MDYFPKAKPMTVRNTPPTMIPTGTDTSNVPAVIATTPAICRTVDMTEAYPKN
jgi:hypothetical protein